MRFQRASDELEKIKKEIEEDFNARENLKEKRPRQLNEKREQSCASFTSAKGRHQCKQN